MGGGTLDNTITFQQNPQRVFDDPCGNFPIFTKESFAQWITDTCNNGAPGFTDGSLNYLINFDAPWQVIGPNVLENLSNIDICNNGGASLTDKFDYPEALTDICNSAFQNMNLSGGLDFTGFTSLKTIGEYAFPYNNLNSLILKDLPSLETIGLAAFQFNETSKIEINNTTLKSIGDYAFATNNLTDISIIDNIDLSSIGSNAFDENPLTGSLTLRNVPSLAAFPHEAIDVSGFTGDLELTGTGFTEIGDFSNGSFQGSLTINANLDLLSINESFIHILGIER
jgi:hypothetical protein